MVTWENYEEYMLMHADGELQAAEEQALMAFVAQHPELGEELELCAAVKLTPDTTMVYANKDALMKPVPATKKVITMAMWQRYAVAAGVAAIICLSVLKFKDGGVEPVAVASSSVGSKTVGSRQSGSVVSNKKEGSEAVRSEATGTKTIAIVADNTKVGNKVTPEKVSRREVIVAAQPTKIRKTEVEGKVNVQEPVVAREQIAALAPSEAKTLPVESESMKMVAVNTMPLVSVHEQDNSKKTLLESLPIEDIKKDGMADMANMVAKTYKRMNALKHGITDEKNFTVRVEKKQLILSF